MIDIIKNLLIVILIIFTAYILIKIYNDRSNQEKCLNSEYETSDYQVILKTLFCKSSDNSIQKLKVKLK